MGKASSTKKIQRAARSGAKTSSGKKRNLLFPGAIALILVVGIGLVAYARSTGPGQGSPKLGEHWHSAFGIYVCDRWVTNLSDRGPDTLGIHTHDDGLIHIHPFLAGATGKSATLGKFFDQVGMEVSNGEITLPPGEDFESRVYKDGETTCDGEEGRVVLAGWEDARDVEGDPELITRGISGVHFDNDFQAFTLAFVPEGEDVPPPPSAGTIEQGATVDGGAVPGGAESQMTEEELREQFDESGGSLPPSIPDEGLEVPAEGSAETSAPDTTAAEGAGG